MIDLTDQTSLNLSLAFDDMGGTVTLTIKAADNSTVLGSVKVEQVRLRAVTDSLATLAGVYFEDSLGTNVGRRMLVQQNLDQAQVIFG